MLFNLVLNKKELQMKKTLFIVGLSIILFNSCNVFKKTGKEKTTLNTRTEKFSYALGLSIGENFKSAGLDSIDSDLLTKGVNDVLLAQDLLIEPEEASALVQQYIAELEERKTEVNKIAEQKFLEENKKRERVTETESGLQYEVIVKGEGSKPTIVDSVTVHYHGILLDGTVFDSSLERGEPMKFPVSTVIPGMQEALLLMPQGSKWKLYIPSKLAYGATGAGGVIKPYSPLIFDVELLDIK